MSEKTGLGPYTDDPEVKALLDRARRDEFCLEPCDRCGTEGRIYRVRGRFMDGSYDEEDCGECPTCDGTGLAFVKVEPITMEDLDQ